MIEVVGHRAFAANYPENTLEAFNKAYEANIKIMETDIQITKDGIVIVNHDETTGRMWDKDLTIRDEDFETLSKLRHKINPDERILTIHDLLQWSTEHEGCRLMLDVKHDNDKLILNKVFDTMISINKDVSYWQEKIIWGFWLLDWYKYGVETNIIKGFDVIVITMALAVAESFIQYSIELNDPNYKLYGISLLYVSSWTKHFRNVLVPIIKKNDIHVFLWTVNKEIDMNYLVGLPIYGIITDDPVKSTAICTILNKRIENKETNVFIEPALTTFEGVRFHSFCAIYGVICEIFYSEWAHFQLLGQSIGSVTQKVLKMIHFM